MKGERVLWAVACGCAVLLLLAPMTPRTSWISLPASEVRAAGGGATDSAGWDWFAPALGIVAIVCLLVGRWHRPRVLPSVAGAAGAAAALAVAGAAALGHWLDLRSGSLDIAGWTIYPAPAVAYFAVIAGVGMGAALVLTGSWLHPGDVEW
jgi:hypothetical protein